jgi:uracil-DNA glycosylase
MPLLQTLAAEGEGSSGGASTAVSRIIHPAVVVGLGERAYRTILHGFEMKCGPFRSQVEAPGGKVLPNGIRAFAVYHCGARIRTTHRPMAKQREDRKRLWPFLNTAS